MKKILFILVFAASTIFSCMAEGHFMFDGLEMDGDINAFTKQLLAKGYKTSNSAKPTIASFSGTYAGIKKCEIHVYYTEDAQQLVYKVGVFFPVQTKWKPLKAMYLQYKDQLAEQYGQPRNDYQEFTSPYYDGDGYELTALLSEKCSFYAYFYQETGNISIGITDAGYGKGQAVAIFKDAANLKVQEAFEAKRLKED